MRVFMESRDSKRHVRMLEQVPAEWAIGGEKTSLAVDALVGEYLTFQVGVAALGGQNLTNFDMAFSDLVPTAGAKQAGGTVIPASAFTCLNLGGTDFHGYPFRKNYSIGIVLLSSLDHLFDLFDLF